MINFRCQLDWAMGCPDMMLNVILDIYVWVFLDNIDMLTSDLKLTDCPPQCGWVSSNQLKA